MDLREDVSLDEKGLMSVLRKVVPRNDLVFGGRGAPRTSIVLDGATPATSALTASGSAAECSREGAARRGAGARGTKACAAGTKANTQIEARIVNLAQYCAI